MQLLLQEAGPTQSAESTRCALSLCPLSPSFSMASPPYSLALRIARMWCRAAGIQTKGKLQRVVLDPQVQRASLPCLARCSCEKGWASSQAPPSALGETQVLGTVGVMVTCAGTFLYVTDPSLPCCLLNGVLVGDSQAVISHFCRGPQQELSPCPQLAWSPDQELWSWGSCVCPLGWDLFGA